MATKTKSSGAKKAPAKKAAPKKPVLSREEQAAGLRFGAEDFSIELLDGANAVLRLGGEERLVGQHDLQTVASKVAAGIQGTY